MPPIKDSGLRIGELAKLTGTTPRAIRHYHNLGLLVEPERDESGYRRHGPQHLIRLVRIRRLRSLDMPLEEIAANLGAQPADVDIAGALRSLARDIEQQIQRLAELRARVLDIAASGSLPIRPPHGRRRSGSAASSISPLSCRPLSSPPRN